MVEKNTIKTLYFPSGATADVHSALAQMGFVDRKVGFGSADGVRFYHPDDSQKGVIAMVRFGNHTGLITERETNPHLQD